MMLDPQMVQVATALVVAATPWIAVGLARAAASHLAGGAGQSLARSADFILLGRATAVALLIVGGFALWLPVRSGWMAVVNGVVFAALATLGLRALHDLDNATRAGRFVDSVTRVAGLVARRSPQYLPSSWRALLFGATVTGVAVFAWRMRGPLSADRRLLVPVGFMLIALVFLWLYETWIHMLVKGPTVADTDDVDRTRRRSVRWVFAAEFVLVTSFLALAHGLLDVDWATSGAWAAVAELSGAVLAVIGCGLALASDLGTRRYLATDVDRSA